MWRKKFLLFMVIALIGDFAFFLRFGDVDAGEYVIFSIFQDVPMGIKGEKLRKNYYVNMGQNQGVKNGTTLDVSRIVSVFNPYLVNGQFSNFTIKVGEIDVIFTDNDHSVAVMRKLSKKEDNVPLLEIDGLMIGDQVQVHVRDEL
ncbi:MAG: hypothetical protein HQK53_13865 [Oligoflexia bacterium]|nr:hypothetical protein [Oligoflexia bacterium]